MTTVERIIGLRVRRELGSGSYGTVYECIDPARREAIAVKVIKAGKSSSEQMQTLQREIEILRTASETSDHVVPLRRVRCTEGCVVIYMDKFSRDLHKIIHNAVPGDYLREDVIWKCARDLVNGLADLHAKHIFHRDIKPANIMVGSNVAFYLADFGLSRQLDRTGVAVTNVGTPYYMAPELWDDTAYDERVDIWSLGCVLYECCTQVVPFSASSRPELFHKIMRGQPDVPVPAQYSPDLATLIDLMLTNDFKQRPTARELIVAFPQLREPGKALPGPKPKPVFNIDDELAYLSELKAASAPAATAALASQLEDEEEELVMLERANERLRDELSSAMDHFRLAETEATEARIMAESVRVQELLLRKAGPRAASPAV